MHAAQEIQTEPIQDLSCAVCGESPEEATAHGCPTCGTVHHLDCWSYNQGCARYACASGPSWRAAPNHDADAAPTGKILLSHLSFGCYDGFYYAPAVASILTIAFEFVALLGPAFGFPHLFLWGSLAMTACILWIAGSAERTYLDLDQRAITKAKVFLGRDLLEWKVWSLARVARLALVPTEVEDRYLLAAVDREDSLLPLAPPMYADGEYFNDARNLLIKLQTNNVFPVEIPHAARRGIEDEVIHILEAATVTSEG
jgi:predicted RNA-binding Zn-ribbon protein involved in translation (DUF1610 family)